MCRMEEPLSIAHEGSQSGALRHERYQLVRLRRGRSLTETAR